MSFITATITSVNGTPCPATAWAFPKSTITGLKVSGAGTKFLAFRDREGALNHEYVATEDFATQSAALAAVDGAPGKGLELAVAEIVSEDGATYRGGATVIQPQDIIFIKDKGGQAIIKFREGNGRNWSKAISRSYLTTFTVAQLVTALTTVV